MIRAFLLAEFFQKFPHIGDTVLHIVPFQGFTAETENIPSLEERPQGREFPRKDEKFPGGKGQAVPAEPGTEEGAEFAGKPGKGFIPGERGIPGKPVIQSAEESFHAPEESSPMERLPEALQTVSSPEADPEGQEEKGEDPRNGTVEEEGCPRQGQGGFLGRNGQGGRVQDRGNLDAQAPDEERFPPGGGNRQGRQGDDSRSVWDEVDDKPGLSVPLFQLDPLELDVLPLGKFVLPDERPGAGKSLSQGGYQTAPVSHEESLGGEVRPGIGFLSPGKVSGNQQHHRQDKGSSLGQEEDHKEEV
jgi:hypothetical protein